MARRNTPENFWSRVDKSGDCWEWQGVRTSPGWHGVVGYQGERKLAHRLAWELEIGPIPDGQRVCHHCDNPPCCNPAHLFLGTQRDNMQDASRKGRTGPQNRDFSRCKRGHELVPSNVYIHPGHGRRLCRICIKFRNDRYKAGVDAWLVKEQHEAAAAMERAVG